MAWRRLGDKPLSEPVLIRFVDAYMRHQGEMSYNIQFSVVSSYISKFQENECLDHEKLCVAHFCQTTTSTQAELTCTDCYWSIRWLRILRCKIYAGLSTATISWRRHRMETFSELLALCEGTVTPVTGGFPHKVQGRGTLMFSLTCAWTNVWANTLEMPVI